MHHAIVERPETESSSALFFIEHSTSHKVVREQLDDEEGKPVEEDEEENDHCIHQNGLPDDAYTTLSNGQRICRVLTGMWQLSGAHGYRPDPSKVLVDMQALVDAGFTTFDLAGLYANAEDLVGEFRAGHRQKGSLRALVEDKGLGFFTKWAPRSGPMPVSVVAEALDVSRRRMQVRGALDMVQFHWWDYPDRRYLDLLANAQKLTRGADARLKAVSLTNFDTERLRIIVEEGGVPIVSNQVSYSLVDTRPGEAMAAYAATKGVKLLCYGTVLGGLLSDKYLGVPEPRGRRQLNTASLGKYKQFVDAWGGWALLQELLVACRAIADKHSVAGAPPLTIANVAVRWVIQQPAVGGAIVGMRLGHTAADHIAENARVFSFALDDEDMATLAVVQRKGRSLMQSIGDCGDE